MFNNIYTFLFYLLIICFFIEVFSSESKDIQNCIEEKVESRFIHDSLKCFNCSNKNDKFYLLLGETGKFEVSIFSLPNITLLMEVDFGYKLTSNNLNSSKRSVTSTHFNETQLFSFLNTKSNFSNKLKIIKYLNFSNFSSNCTHQISFQQIFLNVGSYSIKLSLIDLNQTKKIPNFQIYPKKLKILKIPSVNSSNIVNYLKEQARKKIKKIPMKKFNEKLKPNFQAAALKLSCNKGIMKLGSKLQCRCTWVLGSQKHNLHIPLYTLHIPPFRLNNKRIQLKGIQENLNNKIFEGEVSGSRNLYNSKDNPNNNNNSYENGEDITYEWKVDYEGVNSKGALGESKPTTIISTNTYLNEVPLHNVGRYRIWVSTIKEGSLIVSNSVVVEVQPSLTNLRILQEGLPGPGDLMQFTVEHSRSLNVTYRWSFGDDSGAVETVEESVGHVYNKEGHYNVSVVVRNSVSNIRASKIIFITNSRCLPPTVSMVVPVYDAVEYKRSDDVILESSVSFGCSGSHVLQYDWTITTDDDNDNDNNKELFRKTISTHDSVLIIKKYSMSVGSYAVVLNVSTVGSILYSQSPEAYKFYIAHTRVHAEIKGSFQRVISKNQLVSMDATDSYDPDQPPEENKNGLIFTWNCHGYSFTTKQECFNEGFLQKSPSFILNSSLLLTSDAFNDGYLFSVEVSRRDGSGRKVFHQLLTLQQHPVLQPHINCIECIENSLNSHDLPTFEAVLLHQDQPLTSLEFEWTLYDVGEIDWSQLEQKNSLCTHSNGTKVYLQSLINHRKYRKQSVRTTISPSKTTQEANSARNATFLSNIFNNSHDRGGWVSTRNLTSSSVGVDFNRVSDVVKNETMKTRRKQILPISKMDEDVGESNNAHKIMLTTEAPKTSTSDDPTTFDFQLPRAFRTERVLQKNEVVGGVINRKYLVIKPNVLVQSINYVIKLKITNKKTKASGWTMRFVRVNEPPTMGLCSFKPPPIKPLFPLKDVLYIDCYNWQNKGNQPLMYKVTYSVNGSDDEVVVYYGTSHKSNFTLPSGLGSHDYIVNVKTSIHASDGAFTDVCTQKYQVIPESLPSIEVFEREFNRAMDQGRLREALLVTSFNKWWIDEVERNGRRLNSSVTDVFNGSSMLGNVSMGLDGEYFKWKVLERFICNIHRFPLRNLDEVETMLKALNSQLQHASNVSIEKFEKLLQVLERVAILFKDDRPPLSLMTLSIDTASIYMQLFSNISSNPFKDEIIGKNPIYSILTYTNTTYANSSIRTNMKRRSEIEITTTSPWLKMVDVQAVDKVKQHMAIKLVQSHELMKALKTKSVNNAKLKNIFIRLTSLMHYFIILRKSETRASNFLVPFSNQIFSNDLLKFYSSFHHLNKPIKFEILKDLRFNLPMSTTYNTSGTSKPCVISNLMVFDKEKFASFSAFNSFNKTTSSEVVSIEVRWCDTGSIYYPLEKFNITLPLKRHKSIHRPYLSELKADCNVIKSLGRRGIFCNDTDRDMETNQDGMYFVLKDKLMNIHEVNISANENHSLYVDIKLKAPTPGRFAYPVMVFVRYKLPPTADIYDHVVVINKKQNTISSLRNGFIIENSNESLRFKMTSEKEVTAYIGLMSKSFKTPSQNLYDFDRQYFLNIWRPNCWTFNHVSQLWSREGCRVLNTGRHFDSVACSCDRASLYKGEIVFFSATDHTTVPLDSYTTTLNFLTAILVGGCLIAYTLLLVFTNCLQGHQKEECDLVRLSDNHATHKQMYNVMVETGFRAGAGTTAEVSIVLHGKQGMSETRELSAKKNKTDQNNGREAREPHKNVLFKRSSRNLFHITLPQSLGSIFKVQVWHNNGGEDPSWYLSRITVHDLCTDEVFYFVFEKWFAVEKGDGKVEREVLVSEHGPGFLKVLKWKLMHYICDVHLWFSVFLAPSFSTFTKPQRLTCCLLIVSSTMLLNSLVYNQQFISFIKLDALVAAPTAETAGPASYMGVCHHQLIIGMVVSSILLIPNLLFQVFFRRSHSPKSREKRRRSDACKKEGESGGAVHNTANSPEGWLFWKLLQEWVWSKEASEPYLPSDQIIQPITMSLERDVVMPANQNSNINTTLSNNDTKSDIDDSPSDSSKQGSSAKDVNSSADSNDLSSNNIKDNNDSSKNNYSSSSNNSDNNDNNNDNINNNNDNINNNKDNINNNKDNSNNNNNDKNNRNADNNPSVGISLTNDAKKLHKAKSSAQHKPPLQPKSLLQHKSSTLELKTQASPTKLRQQIKPQSQLILKKLELNQFNLNLNDKNLPFELYGSHNNNINNHICLNNSSLKHQSFANDYSRPPQKPHKRHIHLFFMPVTWFLVTCLIASSLALSIYINFSLSNVTWNLWLQSFFFSLLQSIFINHPFIVLVLSFYAAFKYRNTLLAFSHHQDNLLTRAFKKEKIMGDTSNNTDPSKEEILKEEQEIQSLLARQRSRYLRLVRPPQEQKLIEARHLRLKEANAVSFIKELVELLVQVFLVVVMCFSVVTPPTAVLIKNHLQQHFIGSGRSSFSNMTTLKQWDKWFSTIFSPSLNQIQSQGYIMVGGLELRQHRIDDIKCTLRDHYLVPFTMCLPLYKDATLLKKDYSSNGSSVAKARKISNSSLADADGIIEGMFDDSSYQYLFKPFSQFSGDFKERNLNKLKKNQSSKKRDYLAGAADVWRFKSERETLLSKHVGTFGTYDGGGYLLDVQDISKSVGRFRIEHLLKAGWVDRRSAALILTFTLYHPPSNLYVSLTFCSELPPIGRLYPSYRISCVSVDKYILLWQKTIFACEFLFILVTLWQALRLAQLCLLKGLKSLLRHFWSLVKFLLCILSVVYIGCYIHRFNIINETYSNLQSAFYQRHPVDVFKVDEWNQVLRTLIGLIMMLLCCLSLQLLQHHKQFCNFFTIISRSSVDLVVLMCVLFIWLGAYVSCGITSFGSFKLQFSDFSHALGGSVSMVTLFRRLLLETEKDQNEKEVLSLFIIFHLLFRFLAFLLIISYAKAFILFNFRIFKEEPKLIFSTIENFKFYVSRLKDLMKLNKKRFLLNGRSDTVNANDAILPEFSMAEVEEGVDEVLMKMNYLISNSDAF